MDVTSDFSDLVEREWKWAGSLTQTLKDFHLKLQAWNQDTFGNISRRKKRNEMRLTEICRTLEKRLTEGLLKLQVKLKRERMEILLQEEFTMEEKIKKLLAEGRGWQHQVFSYLDTCKEMKKWSRRLEG